MHSVQILKTILYIITMLSTLQALKMMLILPSLDFFFSGYNIYAIRIGKNVRRKSVPHTDSRAEKLILLVTHGPLDWRVDRNWIYSQEKTRAACKNFIFLNILLIVIIWLRTFLLQCYNT